MKINLQVVQVVQSFHCLPSDLVNPVGKQGIVNLIKNELRIKLKGTVQRMKTQLTVDPLEPFCPAGPC